MPGLLKIIQCISKCFKIKPSNDMHASHTIDAKKWIECALMFTFTDALY